MSEPEKAGLDDSGRSIELMAQKKAKSPKRQRMENRLQTNCFIPRLRRWMKLFAGGGDTGATYFKSFWFANDFGGQRNACLPLAIGLGIEG